jgi:hypothetical protein
MTTPIHHYLIQKRELEADIKEAITEIMMKHKDLIGGMPTAIEIELEPIYSMGSIRPLETVITGVKASFDL